MKIYRIAQVVSNIERAERWVKQYAKTNGGKKCLIYGQCEEFVNDFESFLKSINESEIEKRDTELQRAYVSHLYQNILQIKLQISKLIINFEF